MENKYVIDYKSLALGDNYIEIPIEDSLFSIWEESEIKSGQGLAKIHIVKHGNVAELKAELSGEVKVECDRCLEEFMMPFHYEDKCNIHLVDEMPEDETDDLYIYLEEQQLDLAQWLYESVVLSLPYQWVHPDIKDCNQDMISRISIEK